MSSMADYSLMEEWRVSACGQTARAIQVATHKNVFIKQYGSGCPKEPVLEEGTDGNTYNKKMAQFIKFIAHRTEINNKLSAFDEGGNIVGTIDSFVDNHLWHEVTPLIENVMENGELAKSRSAKNKLMFVKTALNALQTLHEHGIIHLDVKAGNLLTVKRDKCVSGCLIDFDSCILAGDPPPDEVGDFSYMSPELYMHVSDPSDPKWIAAVTEKTDVFSLGITLFFHLTGSLPTYDGLNDRLKARKHVNSCQAIGSGATIHMPSTLDDRFVRIINKMVQCNPLNRPSCAALLVELNGGGFETPRADDHFTWNKKLLEARGYIGGKYDSSGVYQLTSRSGLQKRFTVDELIRTKNALSTLPTPSPSSVPAVPSSPVTPSAPITDATLTECFDTPEKADGFSWNVKQLKDRMYIRAKALGGGQYELTKRTGKKVIFSTSSILLQHYGISDTPAAVPAPTPTPVPASVEIDDEPWDDDPIIFNKKGILARYKGIRRAATQAEGYILIKLSGDERPVSRDELIKMKYASVR